MAGKGRPTKYRKAYCVQVGKLCKKGFIDTEIADFLEVDVATLNRWKLKYPDFCESLKSGKRYSDDKVVDALYNRALGYEVEEVKEEVSQQGTKTTTTTKHLAGDTTAQIFWLKNRQPDEWRNNPEATDEEHKGEPLTINFTVSDPISEVKVTKGG